MGIVPIPSICGAATADAPAAEHEVKPAIAVEPSDRMQDDSYKGRRESEERGMEGEDSEPDDDPLISGESNAGLSFFA